MISKTTERTTAFGQDYNITWVDRFGVWLSTRQARRYVDSFEGKSIGDFGCGFSATFARRLVDSANVTLVDVSLEADLKQNPRIRAIEGAMPGALQEVPSASLDVVLCLSVLEHMWQPQEALNEFHRILVPGGVCLVNVPSWDGKFFLELSAFRLKLSPKLEIDDHKCYYDPRDLWPILVRAGFAPSGIDCFKHKFGLNTFAVCRKGAVPNGS